MYHALTIGGAVSYGWGGSRTPRSPAGTNRLTEDDGEKMPAAQLQQKVSVSGRAPSCV